tara:strand:- start:152 stop:307 length:156 start_codon:yes stop_codon:yes gene_type:complete
MVTFAFAKSNLGIGDTFAGLGLVFWGRGGFFFERGNLQAAARGLVRGTSAK